MWWIIIPAVIGVAYLFKPKVTVKLNQPIPSPHPNNQPQLPQALPQGFTARFGKQIFDGGPSNGMFPVEIHGKDKTGRNSTVGWNANPVSVATAGDIAVFRYGDQYPKDSSGNYLPGFGDSLAIPLGMLFKANFDTTYR
jgi:hypothetical protein